MISAKNNLDSTILVVDDDPHLLLSTSRLLRKQGYHVVEADTGNKGLEKAKSEGPDLVLLDVNLPDMDGIEVCQRIREQTDLQRPYILLISGHSTSSDDQARGMELCGDSFITRPVPNRELVAQVSAFLRLNRERRARQVSEARFEKVIDAQEDAIVIVDNQGIVQLANPATERFFNCSPAELEQTEFGLPILGNISIEVDIVGPERIAEMRTVAIDWEGEPAWLISMRDITVRKHAEEQLAAYSEHLEEMVDARTQELRRAYEAMVRQEKLALLGQMAGSIAHELRNPLGVISNAASYLRLHLSGADEIVGEYLDLITEQVKVSDNIISSLLDFARTGHPEKHATDVAILISKALSACLIPDSVEAEISVPEDLPKIYVDEDQIKLVLVNLIVNACHAMPEGGTLTIRAHRYADGETLGITVEDTGVGIPEGIREHIFEPLFTTRSDGIGLGLATSQILIESHDGRIEVESIPSKQTIFTLILPFNSHQPAVSPEKSDKDGPTDADEEVSYE